jgi:hypothetical protein
MLSGSSDAPARICAVEKHARTAGRGVRRWQPNMYPTRTEAQLCPNDTEGDKRLT